MSKKILIIGAGAQAKYALEIFRLRKIPVIGMITLPDESHNKNIYYGEVIGGLDEFENIYYKNNEPLLLLCSSKNELKEELEKRFTQHKPEYMSAIHPTAIIASTAQIGCGVIINAHAVIQPYASIGNHVMIHAGVIIEHDCKICDFANLSPRVVLAGHVKIGKCATIYTGTVIIPSVKVGEYSTIGAGGVVLKNIGNNKTAVGVPVREIKTKYKD